MMPERELHHEILSAKRLMMIFDVNGYTEGKVRKRNKILYGTGNKFDIFRSFCVLPHNGVFIKFGNEGMQMN